MKKHVIGVGLGSLVFIVIINTTLLWEGYKKHKSDIQVNVAIAEPALPLEPTTSNAVYFTKVDTVCRYSTTVRTYLSSDGEFLHTRLDWFSSSKQAHRIFDIVPLKTIKTIETNNSVSGRFEKRTVTFFQPTNVKEHSFPFAITWVIGSKIYTIDGKSLTHLLKLEKLLQDCPDSYNFVCCHENHEVNRFQERCYSDFLQR